jgi:hypothetical protein
MNKFILCHKCSGVLAGPKPSPLHSCGCISGWIRGFEPHLTLAEAAGKQYKTALRDLDWMKQRDTIYDRINLPEQERHALHCKTVFELTR